MVLPLLPLVCGFRGLNGMKALKGTSPSRNLLYSQAEGPEGAGKCRLVVSGPCSGAVLLGTAAAGEPRPWDVLGSTAGLGTGRIYQEGGRREGDALPRNVTALNPHPPFIQRFVRSGFVLECGKHPELKDGENCQNLSFLPRIPWHSEWPPVV